LQIYAANMQHDAANVMLCSVSAIKITHINGVSVFPYYNPQSVRFHEFFNSFLQCSDTAGWSQEGHLADYKPVPLILKGSLPQQVEVENRGEIANLEK